MAASMTETMPVPAMESTQLRLGRKSATSAASGRLFGPLETDATSTTANSSNVAGGGNCGRVPLQPARRKLTALEAQRVMTVLSTMIRRVELASALPQLTAQRRADLDIGFGADLTARLEEHGVLLDSLGELKDAETKQRSRPSSAASSSGSGSSGRSNRPAIDSATSRHSTSDDREVSPTGNHPDSGITSVLSTRSSITFCARHILLLLFRNFLTRHCRPMYRPDE